MSAVDFQILRADMDGLKWYDSNRLIVATPVGQDTIDIATRFCLSEKGAMVLEEIENQYDISVVLLRRPDEKPDYHPSTSRRVAPDDTLAVFGGSTQISVLAQQNANS